MKLKSEGEMEDVEKILKGMAANYVEKILKAWKRFIKNGFKWEHFTKALYEHLHLHCSFIAHYERLGFYQTYFGDPEDTLKFINQFVTGVSVEYNATWWLHGEYADINEAMREVVKNSKDELISRLRTEVIKNTDLEIQRLQAKRERFGYTWEVRV